MRPAWRCIAAVSLAILAVPCARTAPPAEADEPARGTLVERVTSEVVLIEVFATDLKGHPVKDLRIPDLELKIDNRMPPKVISTLEYIEPVQPAGAGRDAGAAASQASADLYTST